MSKNFRQLALKNIWKFLRRDQFCLLNFRKTLSSNVNKCRALHFFQNNDLAFEAELKRSRFVIFYDRQPLLYSSNSAITNHNECIRKNYELKSVSFTDLKQISDHYGFQFNNDNIALVDVFPFTNSNDGVDDKWMPVVALGLKVAHWKNNGHEPVSQEKLADSLGGQFMDLRSAYFLLQENSLSNLLSKAQTLLRWSSVYKFCPKCSTPLIMKISKSSAACKKCLQIFYPVISPVAITLISDDSNSNVLLVRQPRQVPGVYTAVAGFSETGERLEDTVVREAAEEVGLDVWNVNYANYSRTWPFPHNSLMCAFRATADIKQTIMLDKSELEDGRWFSRHEVEKAFKATAAMSGFFDMNISAINQHNMAYAPPFGTVAYDLIKNWLFNERSNKN